MSNHSKAANAQTHWDGCHLAHPRCHRYTAPGFFTEERLAEAVNVLAYVRAAGYGLSKEPLWHPEANGKCTQKAAYAAQHLIKKGWQSDCLEFWACRLPSGRRHGFLTLCLTLQSGARVLTALDILHRTLMLHDTLPYTRMMRVGFPLETGAIDAETHERSLDPFSSRRLPRSW